MPDRVHMHGYHGQTPESSGGRTSRFHIGEAVEYNSASFHEWIPAKVLAIHSDGSLDLDVRERADPSKVRHRAEEGCPPALREQCRFGARCWDHQCRKEHPPDRKEPVDRALLSAATG